MARTLSVQDIDYLENLSNKDTKDSIALYGVMVKLKNMNEDFCKYIKIRQHLFCNGKKTLTKD